MGVPIRRYKLYIGFAQELEDKVKNRLAGQGSNAVTIDMQTLPVDKQFILIENHQMTASVHYPRDGSSSKNNQQVIEILNPHPDTIAMARTANALLLEAGYTDDIALPVICATQIVQSIVEKKGKDRVLRLICSDAYKVKKSISISKTYGKTFTYQDVINDLLLEFASYGISSTANISGLSSKQLGKSRSFNHGLAEALTSICNSVGYKWYMSAGIIYVEPRGDTSDLLHFTRSIGIYEENIKQAISEIQDTTNKNIKESKSSRGIRLQLNLNGNFSKGEVVDVFFGEFAGRYKIADVKHQLDFEGSNWDTIVECYV